MTPLQRRLAATAGMTLVVAALMVATGMDPNLAVVVPALVAAGVVSWSVLDLARSAAPAPAGPTASRSELAPRVDARIRSLRFNLRSMRDERAERLYRLLVELIDDQLVSAHGVDRHTHPDRARQLLGADLQSFVDDPGKARSLKRPSRLDRIVTQIERL